MKSDHITTSTKVIVPIFFDEFTPYKAHLLKIILLLNKNKSVNFVNKSVNNTRFLQTD
jgi:hypothetical protein